jgi:hypothetical protein
MYFEVRYLTKTPFTMTTEIKNYLTSEFPEIMRNEPELIENIMIDYFDGVESINGFGYVGDEPCEDMMCYVQDRLIDEKWEEDAE